MRKPIYSVSILLIYLYAAACQPITQPAEVSTEAGQALFRRVVLGGAAGCSTCHSLEPGVVMVGPSLAGIGESAANRVEDLSAEVYLRQSIEEPDIYLAVGFPSGVMPKTFKENLSQVEIDSLVAYLMTLK